MSRFSLFFWNLLNVLVIFCASQSAQAYFTVGESAELPKEGQYRIGVEPQLVFNDGGFNFSGYVDMAYNKESSFRAHMGIGDTSFEAAVSYKWIPVPDYDKQPAFGGKVEVTYANRSGGVWDAIRLMPLVSKNFDTQYGPITPYASLPIDLVGSPGSSFTGLQLVGGCEYHHPDYPKWMFGGELGLNLNNAFTYISGNVTYYIDDADVPARKKR